METEVAWCWGDFLREEASLATAPWLRPLPRWPEAAEGKAKSFPRPAGF